jgi:UDP-glucuronate 4-epimerase
MAYWAFTEAILAGRPIRVFNHGEMRRDFTYIDDIVAGVAETVVRPPSFAAGERPHALFNIGNNQAVPLLTMIEILEDALGRSALKQMEPMQPGDVKETYADTDALFRVYGFRPTTSLSEGLPKFVDWYRGYFGV